MRRLLKTILVMAALAGASAPLQAQRMGELTEAVMRAYQQALDLDPQDYITYYRRAVQYFRMGRYTEAAADLNDALKYTPAKDAEMLRAEYSLQADLYRRSGDNEAALKAVDRALTIDSKSYADIYKKGNIYLDMKKGEEAYRTFKSMLSLQSRSQEAMFGMAQAAVLMGNPAEARTLMDEARDNDPTNAQTYCRMGDVERQMGENQKAVVSYLRAVALTNDLSRPLEGLEEIAVSDYPAYCSGFDYVLGQSGESRGSMEYLRGVIDYNTGHYRDAYALFSAIARTEENLTSPFYTRLARTCLILDKIDEARKYAELAVTGDAVADAYLVKADIDLSAGQPATALVNATKAYLPSDPDPEALLAQAKAHIRLGDGAKAQEVLNEAVLLDGENLPALLLRSYVKEYMLKDKAGSKADLDRAASIDARFFPEVAYRAMAQTLSGKTIDGESTITSALQRDASADALAAAAVYYAQTGNQPKAQEYKQKAIAAGCENLFLLNTDNTPRLSLIKAGK